MTITTTVVPLVPSLISPCLEYDPTFMGCRLSLFANQWAIISRDPWILDTIKFGLRIEFWESPFQRSPPRQVAMSAP